MNNLFPQYTTDYISGVMSLRKPQENSLRILEEIMTSIHVQKGMNLKGCPWRRSCTLSYLQRF